MAGDPEAVTSRGWKVTLTGWDHVIELGPDTLGMNHPGAVFLDGQPLTTIPTLIRGGAWEHEFELDGRVAVMRGRIDSTDDATTFRWVMSLDVDGHDLGEPGLIVGPPDRPAVGTPSTRRRRARITALALAIGGAATGLLLPLAPSATRGGGLLIVAAGALLVGLVTIPAALLQASRGRLAGWSRSVLWQLLPFDVGLVLGAIVSLGAGVGTNVASTEALETVAGAVVGIAFLVVGLVGLVAYGAGRRSGSFGAMIRFGYGTACVGLIAWGLAFGLALLGLFGASLHDAGPVAGGLFFGGLALVLIGGLVGYMGLRRDRQAQSGPPGGTARPGV